MESALVKIVKTDCLAQCKACIRNAYIAVTVDVSEQCERNAVRLLVTHEQEKLHACFERILFGSLSVGCYDICCVAVFHQRFCCYGTVDDQNALVCKELHVTVFFDLDFCFGELFNRYLFA